LETTRTRGILRGNAAGQLQIVGVVADQRIKPGEKVLTAGGDQIFPRGLTVGVVDKVVRDPDRDSYVDVIVKPAAYLNRLDEVLIITSTLPHFSSEQEQDLATSETLKGPEVAAAKEQAQKKASAIMSERLPGLTNPNAPAATPAANAGTVQPGKSQSATPAGAPPPPKLLHALHPDRYTPGAAPTPEQGTKPDTKPTMKPAVKASNKSDAKTGIKPKQDRQTAAPDGRTTPKAESGPSQADRPRRNP
jgi:rod shape-determining protein MreC